MKNWLRRAGHVVLALFALAWACGFALAEPYTREAALRDGARYPGVYYVTAQPGDTGATIGIPSISKQTLTDRPTTESPAIVMGAAIPYEERVGFTEFRPISGGALYPPYSYFRYTLTKEANQGVPGTHIKISGFDGSYVIIRVDVSAFVNGAPEGSYLHVKQTGNKALTALLLHEEMSESTGFATFSDAGGNKAGVYALADGGIAMKDRSGGDADTPYVDLIVFSSGTHVAGAETGSADPTVFNADFDLQLYVDQTADYNPSLKYDPKYQPADPSAPTMAQLMMAKYFNDKAENVTGYKIKGSDLELEVKVENAGSLEYWSLRKALAYRSYNNVPIRLISEVPVLEGLVVEGDAGADRHVIFDVNSFDIQIANHQTTGAAALTVRNATLELTDSLQTTGSELAVGNNATMSIQRGGRLIVTEKCQLEVEYDAASTAPGSGQTAPDLNVGVLTIEDGGVIENRGVITVEGTEGKPIDPAAPAQRDVKDAEFHIKAGGTLINHGCLLSYGALYNMGAIENHGRYDDTIASQDPDKGSFTYHRGIQISWKDDVTQEGVTMGHLYNGGDQSGAQGTGARLVNDGDIVLVPGMLDNYGTLENRAGASIYLCGVKDAIIPIQATVDKPLVTEKRIAFEHPVKSWCSNYAEGTLINAGSILAAEVEIVSNGRTGAITPVTGGEMFEDISLENFGQAQNSGAVIVDGVYNFGTLTNEGGGAIADKVVLTANLSQAGMMVDTASHKLDNVYNGALSADGGTHIWTHVTCRSFTVTPATQANNGAETVTWTVTAETAEPGVGVRYLVKIYEGTGQRYADNRTVAANVATPLTSPKLPAVSQNVMYGLYLEDGLQGLSQNVTVRVTTEPVVTPPAPIEGLVYDGTEQTLTTAGGFMDEKLIYRLGAEGQWSETPPAAKDAGSYTVYYRPESAAEGEAASVTAAIGRRPVTVSADDLVSTVGAEQKELTWTVGGMLAGEALDAADVAIATEADLTAVGAYPITVEVKAPEKYPNHAFTATPGTYTVTATDFDITVRDRHGVFSDEATYKGFNIDIQPDPLPEGVTAYFSTATALTAENYETDGVVALNDFPAGAGTHTVYFYITDGANAVSGSKQVVIEKAKQVAPENLLTRAESYRDSGDGIISGLTPRAMEYRRADNDGTYTLAYNEKVYVAPGKYLVRKIADDNHYASPDAAVTVDRGGSITVWFDSNGGSRIDYVTNLSCGDTVPRPADPTLPDADFLGWFHNGERYDFSAPVTMSTTLTAGWAPAEPVSLALPAGLTMVGETAFEGAVDIASVRLPDGCVSIGPGAFRGCVGLMQIVIPASVTSIDATAFEGCGEIYVFGVEDSPSWTFCAAHSGFIFIEDMTAVVPRETSLELNELEIEQEQ